ncbi:MAG: MASE1 domain-containing protein [Nitriliruptoraceae bacterium]|nr:MASE1 domain-containing protein [Nitriliruptoraceae bacterium]
MTGAMPVWPVPVAGMVGRIVASRWLAPMVAVAYFVLSRLLGVLTANDFTGPTFWPAAGLTLAALLLTHTARWPAILGAVFVAETGNNLLWDTPVMADVLWAVANVTGPALSAAIIRQLRPTFTLSTPVNLVLFLTVGALVGPAVSALIGAAVGVGLWTWDWGAFPSWFVGDALGVVVMGPLFLAAATPRLRATRWWEAALMAVLVVASVAVAIRGIGSPIDPVLPTFVLLPVVWAAVRYGMRGAGVAIAAVGLTGGWSRPLGQGPFAGTDAVGADVLFHLYLAAVAIAALLVAVLVGNLTERAAAQRAEERHRRQQAALAALGAELLAARDDHEVRAALERTVAAIAAEATAAEADEEAPDAADNAPEVVGDPWATLSDHADRIDIDALRGRFPIRGASVYLIASASNAAASALDRLDQRVALADRATELEETNGALSRAIAFRDELASLVSHELRSPLTPILGFADVLRGIDGHQPDAGQRTQAIDTIERNARRMMTVLDELLLSARAVSGQLHATPQPTDVVGTIRAVLEQQIGGDDIVLHHDGSVVALVEPSHLGQAVWNLVGNARAHGEPPIEVAVRLSGETMVEITVSDHGPGVSPELRDRLFDRFARGEGDGTTEHLGLGLSVVLLLAEANDGDVRYEPPRGGRPSRFVLRFPRAVPAPAPAPAPAPLVTD